MANTSQRNAIIWRVLRLLLPAGYRRAHAADLLQTHIDAAGGDKNALGVRFWLRVFNDVLITSMQVRADAFRGRDSRARGSAAGVSKVSRVSRFYRIISQGLRDVARNPGFASAVALTLGLGIGANATMYSVLDRMLFSAPEHVSDPGSIRRIFVHGKSIFSKEVIYSQAMAYPDYADLQKVKSFSSVAAYTRRSMTMGRAADSEELAVELATASYFPLLGVKPAVGRFYSESEDELTAKSTGVVLSYDFWQRRFGGARDVIGRTLDIGKGHYPVTGIAPRGFTGADISPVDVWIPLRAGNAIEQGTQWADARGWMWLGSIARLAPGMTGERASAEMTAAWRAARADDRRADKNAMVITSSIIAGRGPEPTREAKVTKALGAVAILVLLIACANAGNLFLAQGVHKRRAYAVQGALGVSRSELVAQLFCESIIIALAAGLFAFVLARVAGPIVFRTLLPDAAAPTAAGLRIAAVTFAFSLFTAITAGLLTAIRSSRIAPIEVLRAGHSGTRTSLLRRGLVGLQASLAVILLVGAGLFLRSLHRANTLDLGLDLGTISLQLEKGNGSSYSDMGVVTYPALERVRAHPSVQSAAVVSIAPYSGSWGIIVDLPGRDSIISGPDGPFYIAAGGDYFSTLGMRIVRGRALTDADDRGAARVAVVNEQMAKAVWPGKDAVGQCLIVVQRPEKDMCTTVVGVVSDYLPTVEATTAQQMFYLPPHHPDSHQIPANSLLVRMRPGSTFPMSELQALAKSASSDIRFVKATSIREIIKPQLRSWQLGATLLTAFGVLALLVAAAGLYSVLAFEVAQRRFELGVRSALGATSSRIIRSLLADVLRTTVLGVAVGLLAAISLGRVAGALLFRVEPTDPLVYAGALVAMALLGTIAAVVPALRAIRVNPRTALAAE